MLSRFIKRNGAVLLIVLMFFSLFSGFEPVRAESVTEVIWCLDEHLDRTEFSTELKGPGWSGSYAGTNVYSNRAGSPYNGNLYYTISAQGIWLKTHPVLPSAGTYEIYVYIPYESGTSDGMISVSDGTYTKEYSVNTNAATGGWVRVGRQTFTSAEPELTFQLGDSGGDWRVDTVKLVKEEYTRWTVADNLDETIVSSGEIAPSYTSSATHVYYSGAGLPLGASGKHCDFSTAGFWIKTNPTLPAAGTYDLYVYVPYSDSSSVKDGRITAREAGSSPKIFTVDTSDVTNGTWVYAGNHTYRTTKPELTFEIGGTEGTWRVDSVEFRPAAPLPSPIPTPSPSPVIIFDDEDSGVFEGNTNTLDGSGSFGRSWTGGSSHLYSALQTAEGRFTLNGLPEGKYDLYCKIPLVYDSNTEAMRIEARDSVGNRTIELYDIKAVENQENVMDNISADGIKTGDWVKLSGSYSSYQDIPMTVTLSKAYNAEGIVRYDQIKAVRTGDLPAGVSYYTMTVNTRGAADTSKINVVGGGTYQAGNTAELHASAKKDSGYVFSHWERNGAPVSYSSALSVTVEADTAFTAVFEAANTYHVTVLNGGDGITGLSVSGGGTGLAYGSQITVMANAEVGSGYEFDYWEENGKAVSSSTEYLLTVTEDTELKAQFKPIQGNGYKVVFKDINGAVLGVQEVTDGILNEIPVGIQEPSKPGRIFEGWDKTFPMTVTENTVVTARYSNDTAAGYTVTADGETAASNVPFDTKVTVTAATVKDGKPFSYWESEGKIVSYRNIYTFFVSGDIALTAVYGAAAVVVPEVVTSPNVLISGGKMSFVSQVSIPEGYGMIECGTLISWTEGDFTVNTAGVTKVKARSQTEAGQYMASLTNVGLGATRYARGYLVYEDGKGSVITVYGRIVSGTME